MTKIRLSLMSFAVAVAVVPLPPVHADNCYVESPNIPNCLTAARELADTEIEYVDEATGLMTEIEFFLAPPDAAVDPVADPTAPLALDTPGLPELDSDGPLPTPGVTLTRSSTRNCFTYGSARGAQAKDGACPPLHWNRSGTTYAFVRIEDHTSAAWPVHAAATYWTGNPRVDELYTTACPSSYHCVKVYDGRYGATGWVGVTKRSYDQYHHLVSASVQYNDSYSLTATQHANATCHEQGHVLGLEHNTSTASCLYYRSGTATTGTSDDMNELTYNMYDH